MFNSFSKTISLYFPSKVVFHSRKCDYVLFGNLRVFSQSFKNPKNCKTTALALQSTNQGEEEAFRAQPVKNSKKLFKPQDQIRKRVPRQSSRPMVGCLVFHLATQMRGFGETIRQSNKIDLCFLCLSFSRPLPGGAGFKHRSPPWHMRFVLVMQHLHFGNDGCFP